MSVVGQLTSLAYVEHDTPEERLRKSMMTIIGTATIAAGVVWFLMYWALGIPHIGVIPLGYSVLTLAALTHFVATRRYGPFRFFVIFLMLVLPICLQWAFGGFEASSAVMVWAALSPMGALMFAGRREAVIWFAGFVVLLGVLMAVDPRLQQHAVSISEPIRKGLYFMNIGGTLTILFLAMQFFERERDAALTRTRELLRDLEQQNAALHTSLRKLEDLNQSKDELFKKFRFLYERRLPALQKTLEDVQKGAGEGQKAPLVQAAHEVNDVMNGLRPIAARFSSEQALRSKRLLLAEGNVKRQIVAKMALAGTGVDVTIVGDPEAGAERIASADYDIVVVDSGSIEVASKAVAKNPNTKTVFMTSDDIRSHLEGLRNRAFLSNVVCADENDRVFTVKNITTTVSKLVTDDIFGLEKYLGWGVEVQELPVTSSLSRAKLIEQMEQYFKQFGLTGAITRRCTTVAEELLSNAIYDAPVDASGKALYNHLPRTQPVELTPQQQATFRFACDGILVAVSVIDPFGALTRETILEYLISCYEGRPGSLNANKGGAGRGLFQIMEASSLVVFNVRERSRTEVCAFFNVDIQLSKRMNERSFHFFYQ